MSTSQAQQQTATNKRKGERAVSSCQLERQFVSSATKNKKKNGREKKEREEKKEGGEDE